MEERAPLLPAPALPPGASTPPSGAARRASSVSTASSSSDASLDEQQQEAHEAVRRRHDFALGMVLLACVVAMWTTANFITAEMVSNSNTGPFAVSYLNSSAFLLYFLPFLHPGSRRPRPRASASSSDKRPSKPRSCFRTLGFVWPPAPEPREERGRARTSWRDRLGLAGRPPAVHAHAQAHPHPHPPRQSQSRELTRHRTAPASTAAPPAGAIDPELLATVLAEHVPKAHLPPLTTSETRRVAMWFSIQWFGANWAVNVALGLTSVASATTLSSAQGLFTLVLGFVVGLEHWAPAKAVATLATLGGVMLVANSDTQVGDEAFAGPLSPRARALLGDLLALTSAMLYASYVIYLKRAVKEDSRLSMPYFWGWVGLWSTVFFAPVGMLLHWTGRELFVLPETPAAWLGMGTNMFITLTSDLFYMLAMLKSSPLVATVAVSLTIPLAAIVEGIWGGQLQDWKQMTGDALVLASFVVVGMAESTEVTADAVHAVHAEFAAEHERLESLATSLDLAVDPAAAIASIPRGTLRRLALSRSRSRSGTPTTSCRPAHTRTTSRAPLPYPEPAPSSAAAGKAPS